MRGIIPAWVRDTLMTRERENRFHEDSRSINPKGGVLSLSKQMT